MPEGMDLELRVVDLAATYTLYAGSLVSLAITYNREQGITEAIEVVANYVRRLQDDIYRCGINVAVPQSFESSEEVMRVLAGGTVVNNISNQLAREYSSKHEQIFLFAVTAGGLVTAEVGGLDQDTEAARSELERIGRTLVLPERIVGLASNRPDRIFIELKIYLSEQSSDKSLVERWIAALKNNKPIAFMIILGIILIALATLTDAISTLYDNIIAPMLGKL